MSETIQLPPMVMTVADRTVTFRFEQKALEPGEEYAPKLGNLLVAAIDSRPGLLDNRQIVIDLEDLPAISSKQLGAMLAVKQACGEGRRIQVINLRPNVRELLSVTRLGDFFDCD
jgi:hypothetical protein